jgi:PHD/YefM family antitoxin component YafN of YafNO toxin-antitoxin module
MSHQFPLTFNVYIHASYLNNFKETLTKAGNKNKQSRGRRRNHKNKRKETENMLKSLI